MNFILLFAGPRPYVTVNEKGERVYHCDGCTCTYENNQQFFLCMKSHYGENPLICQTCGSRWNTIHEWTMHMMSHTNIKSYECQYCGKTLKCRNAYLCHIRLEEGKQPYVCEICGQRCNTSGTLTGHMSSHNPKMSKCKICQKSVRSDLLRGHIFKTHTNTFTCDTCGRHFSRKDNLQIHQRIHTGERPYKCETCDKCFIQMSSLNSHRKTCLKLP
ncbi:unnamed protein product [Owenia fusiformis]|uniref:Uncharacterized protein n=1 Tax=Owenia fusiformis TaxID=6347 RepID=A0A8J1U1Z8_OWEFU|nr:unnamed protein product [Owenia fusiformis]